jgi:glycine zipper 2TM protein
LKQTYWINAAAMLSIVALSGCSKAGQAAEAEKAAKASAPVSSSRSLDAGRHFTVATRDTISSRTAKSGDSFSATVLNEVQDNWGRVAIPAGSVAYGTITEVKRAAGPNSSGTLTLVVSSVTVRGKNYSIDASIDSLATERQGRGISTGDAAKVAGGAAAGAIIGQIIGKNTKGTVIGAVVGGAVGAGYAVATKDSDIRLPEGTHIVVTLRQRLSVSGS